MELVTASTITRKSIDEFDTQPGEVLRGRECGGSAMTKGVVSEHPNPPLQTVSREGERVLLELNST